MATSLAQLAQVEYNDDELDNARNTCAQAHTIFEEIGDHSRAAQVAVRLAYIDVRSNDLRAAQQQLDDVMALALREALHEPAITHIDETRIRIPQNACRRRTAEAVSQTASPSSR